MLRDENKVEDFRRNAKGTETRQTLGEIRECLWKEQVKQGNRKLIELLRRLCGETEVREKKGMGRTEGKARWFDGDLRRRREK